MSKKNKIIQSLTFFIVLGLFSTTLYANSFRVLVFSKTEGFRHSSIPTGIAAITQLGQEYGFIVEATENAALFNFENLQKFEVIIFLSTTGDVLSIEQQNAFEQYIHNGGGFVGIHAASDTEYDWPWYGKLVGAYFDSHPEIQTATIQVTDQNHISTKHLSKYWERTDEWYNYNKNPRGQVHVLATLDESSYSGGNMENDHPIAWMHEFHGGRSWYTGGGHTEASYAEPDFLKHILGGILYASGKSLEK
ncbi:MAG: ThuA domain-containing protein [Bacteroidota bacterium]|nr:ThuA domain-containing protein [Bacteroidota bacterium]